MPQDASAPSPRNQAVEALRILAAFLIVWFHSDVWGSPWAYAGLSVFIILTLQFAFGQNYDRHRSVRGLVKSLLIPWAFWFALYEAIYLAVGRPFLVHYDNALSWLLAGSQIHLWYLPFIFLVLLLSGAVKRFVSHEAIFVGATVLSLLVLATIPIWRPWSLAAGAPLTQYCQAVSPVLLGIVIGLRSRVRFGWLGLAIVLGALVVAGFMQPDPLSLAWPHLIGAALVLTATAWPARAGHSSVERVARYMLGVYLIHPLLIILAPATLFAAGPFAALVIFATSLALVVLLEAFRTRVAKSMPSVVTS